MKKENNEILDVLNSIDLSDNSCKENKTEVTKEEMQQNIYEEETLKKSDFCDLDDEIAKLASQIEQETEDDLKDVSLKIKIKNTFSFLLKYLASSAAIFVMLLIWTNYSAYSELAMNYFNPDKLQNSEKLLYSSVLDLNNKDDKILFENKKTLKKQKKEIKKESKKALEIRKKIEAKTKTNITKNKVFHSLDKLVQKKSEENLDFKVDIVPFENRIIIPRIWKNIPLIDVKTRKVKTLKRLEEIFNDDLAKWVVRYPWSAKPWQIWNVFIFWHSSNFPWIKWKYNNVFALLNNLRKGDNIIVYYNQKKYVYKVKTKSVINPGEVWILKRNKWKQELTLMTCWPIWTSLKRKLIIAELVK